MQPKLPIRCPACDSSLIVTQLSCTSCATIVTGAYTLPLLQRLSEEEQHFMLQFVLCSGSLKEMASQMSISYPTVRNKLDDTIDRIKKLKSDHEL